MPEAVKHILISTLFFSVMHVCVKYVSHIPTSQVVLCRAAVSLIICVISLKANPQLIWGGKENRWWLVARGLAGTAALYLFFFSIQNIPLGTAVAIQYLSPIFTIIIASFAFRESASKFQWICLTLAFAGVVLIQGVDLRVSVFMAGVCVVSALFSACAYNIIRKIGTKEHSLTIVFYFPVVTCVLVSPVAIYQWQWPELNEWLFLLGAGVAVHFAQVYMTRAYQVEKAANIVHIKYLGAVFAVAIGYFMFDESFGVTAMIGIAIIIAGSMAATSSRFNRQS